MQIMFETYRFVELKEIKCSFYDGINVRCNSFHRGWHRWSKQVLSNNNYYTYQRKRREVEFQI